MKTFVPTAQDVRALLRLALPITTAQVGIMLMGVVDTIFVGHVSARELAAVALGNMYIFGLTMFAFGTLWAIDPIVSQAAGAKDHEAIALGVQRGQLLAWTIGAVITLLCIPAEQVFRLLRQQPEVIPRAARFVWTSSPSLLILLSWATLRQSLQALKHTRAIVITILAGNVLNAALNWVFVFGHLGSPALGAVGSAISSVIGRYSMFGLLLVLARKELRPLLRPWRPATFEIAPLMRTLRIGLPIGMQNLVEYTAFAIIAVLAGWFGADAIAGHLVALNLASLTFMVPMGMGSAASVLVGHAIGRGEPLHARRVAASALACGAAFMLICAAVFRWIPSVLAHIFTSVPGVAAVAASLIPIAGLFQVFDGLQVVAAGVLRGAGDTRAAMISNMLGFWLVGTPVSLWLGFGMHGGVVGLWWGFVAGLGAVAAFLVGRVIVRLSGELKRVRVEAVPTLAGE